MLCRHCITSMETAHCAVSLFPVHLVEGLTSQFCESIVRPKQSCLWVEDSRSSHCPPGGGTTSLNLGNASNGREMYVCSNMGNSCTYILCHFTFSILSKWYLQHSLPPSSIPLPSPSPSPCPPPLPLSPPPPLFLLDLSGVWTMHSRGSIHPHHVR